jgi:hypothetical protein
MSWRLGAGDGRAPTGARANAKLAAVGAGALVFACCVAGPVLIGAACVLALGIGYELAIALAVLITWIFLRRHMKARSAALDPLD